MGLISKLADPDFARTAAAAYVSGMSREAMARHFGVAESTITNWKRDTRFKVVAKKLYDERVVDMTRKVDAEIEARLRGPRLGEMSDETLLKMRKELLGTLPPSDGLVDAGTASVDMWKLLDEQPELHAKLQELLTGTEA